MLYRIRIIKHTDGSPITIFCQTTESRADAKMLAKALEGAWCHGAGEHQTSVILDVLTAALTIHDVDF